MLQWYLLYIPAAPALCLNRLGLYYLKFTYKVIRRSHLKSSLILEFAIFEDSAIFRNLHCITQNTEMD